VPFAGNWGTYVTVHAYTPHAIKDGQLVKGPDQRS